MVLHNANENSFKIVFPHFVVWKRKCLKVVLKYPDKFVFMFSSKYPVLAQLKDMDSDNILIFPCFLSA